MTIPAYPVTASLPGIRFRHVVMPDDLAAMNDVANAARRWEGEDWVSSYEEFRTYYEHLPHCDPATDIVVAERDGDVVGYGRTDWREELDGTRVYTALAIGLPDEGRPLLEALIDAMEERCRQIAAGHPDVPKLFDAEAADSATERVRMLEQRGYRPVRYAFEMIRPTLDDPPDAPLPEGLEIRPVQPDQLRAIFDAEQEAFRDHWGATLPTEEDFAHFKADPVEGRYELWRVAWDGDQVAGMVRGFINEAANREHRRRRGYVQNISVRRPWRQRGLARALIAASIDALREEGMTHAALGVDTENPNGALQLYQSCGFEVARRFTTYRKPLA